MAFGCGQAVVFRQVTAFSTGAHFPFDFFPAQALGVAQLSCS